MSGFELDAPWSLHPQVALRPEPFGALLYHFGSRRLSFLKTTELTRAVRALDGENPARVCCARAGLGDPPAPELVASLARLARTGMLVRRSS